MKLGQLVSSRQDDADLEITGLTADSRKVKPGFLFAALSGVQTDGALYIESALKQGARAILAEPQSIAKAQRVAEQKPAVRRRPKNLPAIAYIADPQPRRALAQMAARFYRFVPETIVAVTGTNGKTSVAHFTRQIWTHHHIRAASMGTLGIQYPGGTLPLHHTTPDPVEIHLSLARLVDKGVTHLALEASSHGLAQYRLDGLHFKAAAFTNLSQDHLDYHRNLHDYFQCKARLFTDLLDPQGVAIINTGSTYGQRLEELCHDRTLKVMRVGTKQSLTTEDISYTERQIQLNSQSVTVQYAKKSWNVTIPLVGDFQVANVLTAAGLAIASGLSPDQAFEAVQHLAGVPGRLQWVADTTSGAAVYVDYAHTPAGIETVLKALRPHTFGKLHIVFGAGGDRDRAKRPLMGKAAAKYADRLYVTDDNPRSEQPGNIRAAILEAAPGAAEIGDRAEAIRHAIAQLQQGDILVVAGKGHETGQIVGDHVIPFDDAEEIRACLSVISEGRQE